MKQLIANLDQLRRKLIDLSNRNPLIKYNLSSRNPRHLDIVNQSLDDLWSLVISSEDLYLRFLEESKLIASDKKQEVHSALQTAKEHGINVSLELPLGTTDGNRTKNLQTLLPFDRFLRLVSNIYETARLADEEKGVNSLHCVFGFLEWLEAPNSEVFLTSPLLLIPIEIDSFKTKSVLEGIRLRGDEIERDNKIVNPSLRLKLKHDFNLDLPDWQDTETPSTYFEKVEAIIGLYPKWRIIPRVLIGNFTFPKMALYEDLDISKWGEEASNRLINNPILQQLLGGLERLSTSEMLNDVQEEDIGKPIKGIVFDADSSQLEAIRRVSGGETIVLEGPPGTGKSQTIANLISVAIAQGKKVLFVADKTAAIEVVEQRLTKAGLGPFCLNLHDGSRVGKEHMYARLEERLELGVGATSTQNSLYFDNSLSEKLSQTASKLDSYFFQLAHSPNSSSQPMAKILWSSICSRHYFNDFPGLIRKITIPNALSLSTEEKAGINDTLIEMEEQVVQLNLDLKGLSSHPLFGLKLADPSIFKKEQITDQLIALQEITSQLINLAEELASLRLLPDQTLSTLEALPLLIEVYTTNSDYPLQQALISHRNVDGLENALTLFTTHCPKSDIIRLNQDAVKNLKESISLLSTFLQKHEKDYMTIEEVVGIIEDSKNFIKILTNIRLALLKILPIKILEESCNWAQLLKSYAEFLDRIQAQDDLVKKHFNPAFWNQLPEGHWIAMADKINMAKELSGELQDVFLTETLCAVEAIDDLTQRLEESSKLRYLKPAWWQARFELTQLIGKEIFTKHTERLKQLERLRYWQQLMKEIRTDPNLVALVGNVDDPFTIDFASILRTQVFFDETQISIPDFLKILQDQNVSAEQLILQANEIIGCTPSTTLLETAKDLEAIYKADSFVTIEGSAKNREQAATETLDHIQKLGIKEKISNETLTILSDLLNNLEQLVVKEENLCDRSVKDISDALYLSNNIQNKLPLEIMTPYIEFMVQNNQHEKEELNSKISKLSRSLTDFKKAWIDLKDAAEIDESALLGNSLMSTEILVVLNRLATLNMGIDQLSEWAKTQKILRTLLRTDCPAQGMVENYIKENRPFNGISHSFAVLLEQCQAREAFTEHKLSETYGADIQSLRKRFEREDAKWKEASVKHVKEMALSQPVWRGSSLGPRREWTGLELIRNELAKKQRRISQRQLIARAGSSMLSLTPCFMMSPITVAQYLAPASGLIFDLILIDEASQMRPEEALSAIARGTQVVVVGDSQQLPPTNFYCGIVEDDQVSDEDAIDNESILDMTKATFKSYYLRWHYRSRHDSLIHFSNVNFYDGRLIVCPSPRSTSSSVGLQLSFVAGTYKDSINNQEAQQVVAKAVELLQSQPNMSIGIVAINREQRELISTLLYEERYRNQDIDASLDAWEEKGERCFVKNLENVQGDERDIILISTVYGPSQVGGRVLRNFGPINSSAGHRRLNVLFTRARDCMYVFTSLKPSDVCPADLPSPSRGAEALAQFLEFAGSGIHAPHKFLYRKDPDSPFEEYVGNLMKDSGYEVEYQVGQSGFRIDIGVKHPSFPYGYIAGIECDGAAYHSSKSARDRDRLRQDILETHGWRIYRIWSTDWFNDPHKEGQKLIKWLDNQRAELTQQINNIHPQTVKSAELNHLRNISGA